MNHPSENVDSFVMKTYKIGGIALLLFGVCYILGGILSLVIGPSPAGIAYFTSLAKHPTLSFMNFTVFIVAHLFLIPGVIALYLVLRHNNKIVMIIATGILAAFIIMDIGITELISLSLVSLSQNYAASSGSAQAAFLSEAQNLLGILPLATLLSFVVSSIGFIVIALVMMKGPFTRLAGIIGIIVGIEGILAGFYIVIPSLSLLMIPSLFTAALWAIIVGVQLNKLGNPGSSMTE